MKKTYNIPESELNTEWDIISVRYFNKIDSTYFDYALDNVIDIIDFWR